MREFDLPPESEIAGSFIAVSQDAANKTSSRDLRRGRGNLSPFETLHFNDAPFGPRINDETARLLAGISPLGFISMGGSSLTKAGIKHIAALPELKMLRLESETTVTAELIEPLLGTPTLHSLHLYECIVDDDAIRVITTLPALQSLICKPSRGQCLAITDVGLAHLAMAPALVSLSLEFSAISGSGLAEWARLTSLQSVELRWFTHLTDKAAAYLGAIPSLTSVRLPLCSKLTDAIFDTLAKLPALEWTDLTGIRSISNAGLMKLTGLLNLNLVYVSSSNRARKITKAGIETFEKTHGKARCIRH